MAIKKSEGPSWRWRLIPAASAIGLALTCTIVKKTLGCEGTDTGSSPGPEDDLTLSILFDKD